ncbi:MAG TPA: penicillin-binding protein 2 [Flavobacterium sp.]|nr:penicillin-binding protein 2 [Flavobacterium sp.]
MRKVLLPTVIIISTLLIVVRLFYLQIIDQELKLKSENNALRIVYDYPERGYIYDRNGKLLVANQPSYDIMVTPKDVKNIDTLEFCRLLNISKDDFLRIIKKARDYSPRLPSVFLSQLNKSEYAALQEKMRKFEPGFEVVKRSLRDYQVKVGANIFGSIAQVSPAELEKNHYYHAGDLIGRQGVEQSYEKILRGVKGVKYRQKDKFNRDIGPYQQGRFDTIAKQGEDITLTIDALLQEYGEKLMINKRGGIVAIEPKTGEILALVTAPSYDPSILVGRQRSRNYTQLYNDSIAKPLFDRGLLSQYPPGSPFKIITGLIALQEGAVDEQTTVMCHHGFSYAPGRFMRCHGSGPHQLHNGIYNSCNAYFGTAYMRTINKYRSPAYAVDVFSKHARSFGLGEFMGYDLPTGKRGKIPTSKTYKRMYPNGGWKSTTIVSNAIGQGEVLATPIQLANMISAVANKGYYYTPHIIKKIKGEKIDPKYTTKHVTTIDKKYFDPMISGLFDVYNFGTASHLRVEGINICGKTGTAENFAKIGGKRIQLKDHSIFVAFAPMENPKIAIAVFVENGGFGATIAGPIASLMIEKYLRGKITQPAREKFILEKSLQAEYDRYTRKAKDTLLSADRFQQDADSLDPKN